MSRFTLLLLFAAAAVATAAGTNYTFRTSCNGNIPLFDNSFGACLEPNGQSTLADTVIFPAGTNVNIGSGVGNLPYYAFFAQNVVIEAGAIVTFSNGMMAVEDGIYVLGTLNLNGSTGMGGGPWDDAMNPKPLPNYQLPGFTPNVIGQSPANKTVMHISGTVNLQCHANGDSSQCYPSIWVDVVVELSGTLHVSSVGWFMGHVRNFGIFTGEGIYFYGPGATNEVSGEMTVGIVYCGDVVNYGHYDSTWSSQNDRVDISIVNFGTMTFSEGEVTEPHASGKLGEVVFAKSVDNRGTLTLQSLRIRSDRFLFEGPFMNSGNLLAIDCGLTVARDLSTSGSIKAHTSLPHADWITFNGQVQNDGTVEIAGLGVTMNGGVANKGTMSISGQQLDIRGEVHNSGVMQVHHTGTNVVVVDGDVVNQGTMEIGAGHATLKQDLFNDGSFSFKDTQAKRSRCFVEGRTYSTGNISLSHAHLTVTSLLQHGDSLIDLSTKTATLTLGAWGTSLQRGVARGYLRRETADDSCVEKPVNDEGAAIVGDLQLGGKQCVGTMSCDECCPDSELCMVYYENVYCDGYGIQPPVWEQQPQQRFMLSASTVARMPPKMRQTLAATKFQHPHAFFGEVRVSGPGALTTTDTLEVQGHLHLDRGAEVFSMVEHAKSVAAGPGHITVQDCAKWFLGNDATYTAATPNVTVTQGGALVVPRHADVQLAAGHLHVHESGRVHVDGSLAVGAPFGMHAHDGFRIGGRGKVTKKEA